MRIKLLVSMLLCGMAGVRHRFMLIFKRWKKGNDVFPFSDAPNTAVFYAVTYWAVGKKYYLFHMMRMTEHGNSFVVKNIMKAMQ